MNILVINCGSSSLGFKVYQDEETGERRVIASGKARNVAAVTKSGSFIEWTIGRQSGKKVCAMDSHRTAATEMLKVLNENQIEIHAIGHRFVHGGERFTNTIRIDNETQKGLQECLPLAPIHNPNSYNVIEVCLERLPQVPQYAVFDTAFHASMPAEAREYAIPRDVARAYGLRKYGFHGLSYQYVSRRAAEILEMPIDKIKLIMCHLGTGGSSVCAFANGQTVETSMGYSPLAGLVMSTRCGDIDAEVVLELARQGLSTGEVESILNDRSGLIGLSGYSSNLEEVIAASEDGNKDCLLAYTVYSNRLKFYLGAYTWILNGADAIVFTDDIGVKSWKLREQVCGSVDALGIYLDLDANHKATHGNGELIQSPRSRTKIMVISTDEESEIYSEVLKLINQGK